MTTVDDLRIRLREKFAHSEFDLSDLCLVEPGVPEEVVLRGRTFGC